ncbi:FkbM family methyltransferase [Ruegeria profundi]|uniref:FkbM family methyltransferase n=1 Tax=Ruegeria profundi TaxID=1685378 RepID=UPI003C7DC276
MRFSDLIGRKRKKKPESKYFGLNSLDQKLEPYVDFDNGFYVELGANDGVNQSNTLYFEKERNWRGVLIEPSPHNFLKCLKRRGENNQVHCNACVEFGFPDKFVEMAYANLMTVPVGMELDLPDPNAHLLAAQQHMRETERTFTFGAAAKPLNDILVDSNAPSRINFLSLDVEGAELSVLKGLDHNQFRFDYMLIECRDYDRMASYLESVGYKLEALLSQHDYLFKDERKNT